MLTSIIFAGLATLTLFAAWRQRGPLMRIMVMMLLIAIGVGLTVKQQPLRDVIMILLDLAAIFAIRWFCVGGRASMIALATVCIMALRTSHIANPAFNQFTYAAAINTASALQAFIGGGWLDGIGHRLLDWASRNHPGVRGVFRHLAGV